MSVERQRPACAGETCAVDQLCRVPKVLRVMLRHGGEEQGIQSQCWSRFMELLSIIPTSIEPIVRHRQIAEQEWTPLRVNRIVVDRWQRSACRDAEPNTPSRGPPVIWLRLDDG